MLESAWCGKVGSHTAQVERAKTLHRVHTFTSHSIHVVIDVDVVTSMGILF